jgi:hypothetical protein
MPVTTARDELRDAHARLSALVNHARDEDRDLSAAEQAETQELQTRMERLAAKLRRHEGLNDLLTGLNTTAISAGRPARGTPFRLASAPSGPGVHCERRGRGISGRLLGCRPRGRRRASSQLGDDRLEGGGLAFIQPGRALLGLGLRRQRSPLRQLAHALTPRRSR